MPVISSRPVGHFNSVVLVDPTKYLGNLLIAGGLMQAFGRHCSARGIRLVIVLDESFRELVDGALPEAELLFYPRRAIGAASWAGKLRLYAHCLRRLRRARADLAFTIEEDAVSHRLTQCSGARFRLGCSTARHGAGYDQVVPVSFQRRPADRGHRWHGFQDVFQVLGMAEPVPGYMRLAPPEFSAREQARLAALGVDFERPLVALHAGATKDYKKWPSAAFAQLVRAISAAGMQAVLIGAGADAEIAREILAMLESDPPSPAPANLCNRLSLAQLAGFFTRTTAMVGNDSGPFHLASALGVPGVVIFGPTDVALWRPLSARSRVMSGMEHCAPDCTRRHCRYQYRCLTSITPVMVMESLRSITTEGPAGP